MKPVNVHVVERATINRVERLLTPVAIFPVIAYRRYKLIGYGLKEASTILVTTILRKPGKPKH